MSALAQPALGAVLSYSTDNGVTFTVVGQVSSIAGVGGGEMGQRDTTVLSSTLHTARPTIPKKGPLSFGLLYDPTDTAHQTVRDWASTPAATDPTWKIQFNIATTPNTCKFTGFVTSFDGANAEDVDSNIEADVEVFINSIPTWS